MWPICYPALGSSEESRNNLLDETEVFLPKSFPSFFNQTLLSGMIYKLHKYLCKKRFIIQNEEMKYLGKINPEDISASAV